MNDSKTWAYIDEQRADLADLLDTLTPDQWETPSLCRDWSVRQVAAHLTHSTANWGVLTLNLLRSGLRFDALTMRMAREDRRSPAEITAALREMVGGRRRPPGTAVADPLMDVLVHGQDIVVPLGIQRTMPIPAAEIAAHRAWTMGFPFHARRRHPNTEFTAIDTDFSVGSGDEIRGSIQDILMILTGRRAALPVE